LDIFNKKNIKNNLNILRKFFQQKNIFLKNRGLKTFIFLNKIKGINLAYIFN